MGIKPNKLELNKILWDELTISITDYFNTRYANTKISDKAKNDLIKRGVSDAVVYWNLQANKEAKTIGRNPKKEIAKKRLNILRQRSDSNEIIIKAINISLDPINAIVKINTSRAIFLNIISCPLVNLSSINLDPIFIKIIINPINNLLVLILSKKLFKLNSPFLLKELLGLF